MTTRNSCVSLWRCSDIRTILIQYFKDEDYLYVPSSGTYLVNAGMNQVSVCHGWLMHCYADVQTVVKSYTF